MRILDQLYEGKAKKVFATDDPQLLVVRYKDDAVIYPRFFADKSYLGTNTHQGRAFCPSLIFILRPERRPDYDSTRKPDARH